VSRRRSWTDDQLIEACKTSESYASVRKKLGLKGSGSHALVRDRIENLGIQTDHFLGQGWALGKTSYSDERIGASPDEKFCKGSKTPRNTIKEIIIKEGLIPYACDICGNDGKWMGEELVLQLDHVNGRRRDHRLSNLRFLCPNCHSQTPTYCGKNKSNAVVSDEELLRALREEDSIRQALLSVGLSIGATYNRAYKLMAKNGLQIKRGSEQKYCVDCGAKISCNATRCKPCAGKHRANFKIDWPSCEELRQRLDESNYSALGRELGVSDNAIKKHLRVHCQERS
jgi:hypothetical protein